MLSCKPYKGVRDFPPEKKRIHDYLLSIMQNVPETFGYEKYDASVLEHTEIYLEKDASNQEIIEEQTYTFKDRKNRSVTLRPEMTPTLARLVACYMSNSPMPLRLYSVPNCFRYERPQKGRLREFWQLNVDILGDSSIYADAEVISVAYSILKAYNVPDTHFEIHINDRAELESVFEKLDILDYKNDLLRLLDSKPKMGEQEFSQQLNQILPQQADAFIQEINNLEFRKPQQIIKILNEQGIKNAVVDPSIVRGFAYYTGTVFEIFAKNAQISRALFGGGRYDNLLNLFSNKQIPAVGFGMGDVAIEEFLKELNLLNPPTAGIDVVIAVTETSDKLFAQAHRLAEPLRESGLKVIVDFSDSKLKAKLEKAIKKDAKHFIAFGEKEIQSQTLTLKDLQNRTQEEISFTELKNILK